MKQEEQKQVAFLSRGRAMIIYDILAENKNNFKFIGKSAENVDLICRQITEFKKHGITDEKLTNIIESEKDEYLKLKIQDMEKVFEGYNNQIKNKYIDENDNLTILMKELENITEFKNCEIYIDEFVGFTKQEYEILRILMRYNNIYITVCTDSIDISNDDTDIFYSNKQTLNKIYEIAKEEKIKIENEVKLEISYRFKTEELKHLEKNIYNFPYRKYIGKVENINLFLAQNQYEEIEYVGKEIVNLVREKNYRYNEIAVITKDLEQYSNLCKAIFSKYHIPVFIDEKKDLSQNILVRYLLSILNIFAKNWSYESVFQYLKTGFLDIESIDINILENYCLRWGIRGNKWYKGDWNFFEETEEEKEKILHIKEQIVLPLLKLKEDIEKQKDVKNITMMLYNFIDTGNIIEKLESKKEKLLEKDEIEKAQEYETSWKIIIDVLDEIVLIFGEKKISFEKYIDILKIGLKSSSLGKIPSTQDQIIVGDVDRSRSHKVKAVFIIGLNDGMFPSIHKDEGFFNDLDREKMKNEGLELAKGTMEKLYDDSFNIYKAFSTAEEMLYLTYSSSDLEGKSLRSSILLNRIKKVFPELKEKSSLSEYIDNISTEEVSFESLLDKLKLSSTITNNKEYNDFYIALYEYYMNNEKWNNKLKNSIEALEYTNEPNSINKTEIVKMYGNNLKTSISRLEQYSACPFSYYLKYGLKLSDKTEFKVESIDTGTFMHDVIDTFFEKIENKHINIKVITEEQIQKIVDEVIEEKLNLKKNYIFTSVPKYRVMVMRLRKVIKKSMKYIVDSLKYSKFEILGHEMEFKNGKEYERIEIKLDNGKKVEITGKIDRIDIAKMADGNYIRIIDYKSSVKDINLNEVVGGLQLQLLTYLNAACEINNFLPAGVLYFNLIDSSIKAEERMTEEQIEEELRKQFRMKGLIVADIDIVKMMDTSVEQGKSQIIPAYIDKDGNLSEKSSIVNRKQFENLQRYTKKMIEKICNEIFTGNISIKPYYKIKDGKTPCEYCSYKSICNFNNGICKNSYRYIGNVNKEIILDKIETED